MNKSNLAEIVSESEGLSKAAAERILNLVFDEIMTAVCKGDSVTLTGFGTFSARTRKAAQRINPQTRMKMTVPAKVVPKFKAGKEFKEKVAKSMRP
jgi:DNA-binding protein HU-beta